jgi:hypothetical protein
MSCIWTLYSQGMFMSQQRVNYDDVAATYDARYASGVGEGQHGIPAALSQLLK